jgi:uncharacterized protein with von Willebrand factor type A (vWA) domain
MPEDILASFKEAPQTQTGGGGGLELSEEITGGAETKPLPDTALQVDLWNRDRASDLLEESIGQSGRLCAAAVRNPGDWDDKRYVEEHIRATSEVADFHTAAFEIEPKLHEACRDQRRHDFVRALLENPDYAALHNQTALDTSASELATLAFAEQYAALVVKDEERKKKPRRKGDTPEDDAMRAEIDAVGAASEACARASEDVREYGEMCRGLGGDGSDGQRRNPTQLMETFRKVRSDRRLNEIMKRAGSWRRCAQARQRQKARHGYDDMVGLKLDGVPALALPHELASLCDDDLELDALRRLAERQFLCRDYRGLEPKGKGAIIGIADTSGSMDNAKGYNAKAICLTLGWIASHEKRWLALVDFSGGTEGFWIVVKPDEWGRPETDAKMLRWLSHFYGGGTTMDVPLAELPRDYWPKWREMGLKGKPNDVFIFTDAIVSVPTKMRQDFCEWKKKEGVRLTTVVIGERSVGDMASVSDSAFTVPALKVDNEELGKILSV